MSIEKPKDVRAWYAGRIARKYHDAWRVWRITRSPELTAVMADLTREREDHQTRTGWYAYYDGHTTTYHYTDPKTREDTP